MQIIEPVFSDITYCKGMDRFTLRGEDKVNSQWKLYCIVHNIGKCMHKPSKTLSIAAQQLPYNQFLHARRPKGVMKPLAKKRMA